MLNGRCVVVTGASGNLGTAVCKRLLREGARVMAVVRRESDRVADGVLLQAADLEVEAAVEAAYSAAEPVWASVHCAGGWVGGTVAETSLATFEKMIALNLRSAFLCCRAALRRMEPRGEGRIVNVAAWDAALLANIGGAAAYGISKAGVVALTKAIGEGGRGVRCSCVAPGTLKTRQNASAMSSADQSKWVPLEDVAEAIAWLVSPESGAVNGAVVTLPSR